MRCDDIPSFFPSQQMRKWQAAARVERSQDLYGRHDRNSIAEKVYQASQHRPIVAIGLMFAILTIVLVALILTNVIKDGKSNLNQFEYVKQVACPLGGFALFCFFFVLMTYQFGSKKAVSEIEADTKDVLFNSLKQKHLNYPPLAASKPEVKPPQTDVTSDERRVCSS